MRKLLLVIGALCLLFSAAPAAKNVFQRRYVFYAANLYDPADAARLGGIMERAAAAGYNGLVLADASGEYNGVLTQGYRDTALALARKAASLGMALIPDHFAQHDPSYDVRDRDLLQEAFPVKGTAFRVFAGSAAVQADPAVALPNGGFEDWDPDAPDRPAGFVVDAPGQVTFRDAATVHSGAGSVRIQDTRNSPGGYGRIYNRDLLAVAPGRAYRVSVWIKTRDLTSPVWFQVYGSDAGGGGGRWLYINRFPGVASTQDWKEYAFSFNSITASRVRVYLGIWDPSGRGTAWFDDAQCAETGLDGTVRRSGTPVTVSSPDGAIAYRENIDYAVGERTIFILPGSAVPPGALLSVDWYQRAAVFDDRPTASSAEPGYFEALRADARKLSEAFGGPYGFMMDYNEWRVANWNTGGAYANAGSYVAETVRRTEALIRDTAPGASISVWSDMFDPFHNAVDVYYAVNGPLEGSVSGVSTSTLVMNWNSQSAVDERTGESKTASSLKFFAGRGYRQAVCGYYDGGTDNVAYWLKVLDALESAPGGLPGVEGFMYTTWITGADGGKGEYRDLEAVADFIRKSGRWAANNLLTAPPGGPAPPAGVPPGGAPPGGAAPALAPGEVRAVGSAAGRGSVNPDRGETARVYFNGTGTGRVEMTVFTLTGELVARETQEEVRQGYFTWDPRGAASGIYLIRVRGPGIDARVKIAVLR